MRANSPAIVAGGFAKGMCWIEKKSLGAADADFDLTGVVVEGIPVVVEAKQKPAAVRGAENVMFAEGNELPRGETRQGVVKFRLDAGDQFSQRLPLTVFDGDALRFAEPGLGMIRERELSLGGDFVTDAFLEQDAGILPAAIG